MKEIKYFDNSEGHYYGEKSNWDAERDYKEEYVKVYFRIDAKHYKHPFKYYEGYEGDKLAFCQEVRQIFKSMGWTIIEVEDESSSDKTSYGKSKLYLHPMNFSGVIMKNEVGKIAELLNQAQTFNLRCVDLYKTYCVMSDEDYASYLLTRRQDIQKYLFEECKTMRRNKFKDVQVVCRKIAEAIQIHRVEREMSGCLGESQEEKYIQEVMEEMISEGYLVPNSPETFSYVRSINKTEQKQLKLAAL